MRLFQPLSENKIQQFLFLVANETENNQERAERMLQDNPELLLKRGLVHDFSGRKFLRLLNAYEYAFLAGDTRMLRLFNRYLKPEQTHLVYQQCVKITQQGLQYIRNDAIWVEKALEYYKPILLSYAAYIEAIERQDLPDPYAINFTQTLRTHAYTCFLQEYCSPRAFYSIYDTKQQLFAQGTDFKEPDLLRTVQVFYSPDINQGGRNCTLATLNENIIFSPYLSLTNHSTSRMCFRQDNFTVDENLYAVLCADYHAIFRLSSIRRAELELILNELQLASAEDLSQPETQTKFNCT